jgi:hypothetical protein
MNKIMVIIIGAVGILFIFFGVVYLMPSKTKEPTEQIGVFPETTVGQSDTSLERIVVKGIIKKEKIPRELELGDYWYWVYFDSPLYVTNNASGEPGYVSKLEVYPPKDNQLFETFLNTHVEIDGSWTGGYAESSVIQINSLKIIK